MTPEIQALPFDQLRTLHREIGALIAQRRHEALEKLKQEIAVLGFSVDDLVQKKKKRKRVGTGKVSGPGHAGERVVRPGKASGVVAG